MQIFIIPFSSNTVLWSAASSTEFDGVSSLPKSVSLSVPLIIDILSLFPSRVPFTMLASLPTGDRCGLLTWDSSSFSIAQEAEIVKPSLSGKGGPLDGSSIKPSPSPCLPCASVTSSFSVSGSTFPVFGLT